MIDRELYINAFGNQLVRTYSDEGYKLKQEETETIYSSSVIDVIEGYSKDGKPYSRYIYTETDIKEEPSEEELLADALKALEILGVVNDEESIIQ